MIFSAFKAAVKAIAFPKGEAENLVGVHNAYLAEGLVDLQRSVPCFRDNHTDVLEQSVSYFYCGMSVLPVPSGALQLKRLYTITAESPCEKVFYTQTTRADLECKTASRNCDFFTVGYESYYLNDIYELYPGSPPGVYYPNLQSDYCGGRAARGWWAIEGDQIFVFPAIQSTESVVLEWAGIKTAWADSDTVFSDSLAVQRAARNYLLLQVATDLDCDDSRKMTFSRNYRADRSELIWECRKKTEGGTGGPCNAPSVSAPTTGCTTCSG